MGSAAVQFVQSDRGWRGGALSIALGGMAALGQAPFDALPVSLLGFLLIALRLHSAPSVRQAFWRGWSVGLGYFGLSLLWIVEPFLVDLPRHGWMAPFALILMSGGLALFWGAAGALAAWPGKGASAKAGNSAPVWILSWILALTLAELLRSYVFTGFPWALIGHIWIDWAPAQLAAYIGPHGLTMLTLALTGVAPGLLGHRKGVVAGGMLAGLALSFGLGLARIGEAADTAQSEGRPIVRLVQPNAPQHQKWDADHIPVFFRRLIDGTRAETGSRPDLIVWPETSVPVALNRAEETLGVMARAAQGVPLVFGIQRFEDRRVYNSAVLLGADGSSQQVYDKAHLVPFGEYIPFGDQLSALGVGGGLAARDGNGFSAGQAGMLLDLGPLGKALPLICYEAVFPNAVNAAPERPALLLQLTNDAWFGDWIGPYQHLAQARLRAIEQGLPMVRAANTGVSAVIDPKGWIVDQLPLGVDGFLDVPLPEAREATLYARFGDYLAICAMMALFCAVIAVKAFERRSIRD